MECTIPQGAFSMNLVFVALLTISKETSSSSSSCSSFFCKEEVLAPEQKRKCTQIMENSASCTCHLSAENQETYCVAFTKANLRVNVHDSFKSAEARLVVSTRGTTEYNILMDLFLTYLPLTNITTFHFTSFCSYRHVSQCNGLPEQDKGKHATWNLSKNYKVNIIKRLVVVSSCIRNIDGRFSYAFPNLQEINLSQNLIEHITTSAFDGLYQLQRLDLHCNRLIRSSWSSLHSLTLLKYLDISFNIELDFNHNILENLTNLHVLNISGNTLIHLPRDAFKQNTRLQVLDVSNCSLGDHVFNDTQYLASRKASKWFFDGLTNLRVLSLDQNAILDVPTNGFQYNTELIYLSLKRNSFQHLTVIDEGFNNPINLDLTGNCLPCNRTWNAPLQNSTYVKQTINQLICQSCCLNGQKAGILAKRVIVSADFRKNPVLQINMDFLRNVSHLETLYLSPESKKSNFRHLDIRLTLTYPLYVDPQSENPRTNIILSRYVFSVCHFVSLMRVNWGITQPPGFGTVRSRLTFVVSNIKVGSKSYRNISEIAHNSEISRAICNFTFYCPEKCICHTVGFDETVVVNCKGKRLPTFPNITDFRTPITLHLGNNKIRDLKDMGNHNWSIFKEIFLDNNRLEFLGNFILAQNLQTLDLRNNRLKHFSSLERLLIATRHRVMMMLSGNQWRCDCTTQRVLNLLKKQDIVDFHQLACKSIYSQQLLFLLNATDIDLCPIYDSHYVSIKILLPIFAAFVVLLCACFIIYYRCKKFVLLWLFKHDFFPDLITEDVIDADKTYDAFVAFSSLDEDWVETNLVQCLENKTPSFKLCLHNRDWLAGEWIIEQIFLSVEQSRRTIIVLTENFLASNWSRLEFLAAYKQSLDDKVNRVIIVLPGKVPQGSKLAYELRTFLRLNTYISWNDSRSWRKLLRAMSGRKRRARMEISL